MLLHLLRMDCRCLSSVGESGAWMSIVSALWVAHLELFVKVCFTSFHAWCGVLSPFDATRCLYHPDSWRNAVILDEFLSRDIWLRPSAMLMVAKHAGMSGLSVSLVMYLLSGERSVTRSMLPPGLGTKKAS